MIPGCVYLAGYNTNGLYKGYGLHGIRGIKGNGIVIVG
jgi:hypothetical protein